MLSLQRSFARLVSHQHRLILPSLRLVRHATVLRFEKVCFEYEYFKPLLADASFNVPQGSKVTLMGQNGSGKSTIFKLINRVIEPTEGKVHIAPKTVVATAQQVIPVDQRELTVLQFFQRYFPDEDEYFLHALIADVLQVVNLQAPIDRKINSFSGGQQARLLLASALIVEPDLLLLDEPTNNLDTQGKANLTRFLKNSNKTAIVISHDADFLNAFTDSVLYLDQHTQRMEHYPGNYRDVVREIGARIERENRANFHQAKQISAKREQAAIFAEKGGNMRSVAKKMRDAAARMESKLVEVRQEDRAISNFTFPNPHNLDKDVIKISQVLVCNPKDNFSRSLKPVEVKMDFQHRKMRVVGPNGIGKTTFLEALANGTLAGASLPNGINIGYYRQDFSGLDMSATVYDYLDRHAKDQEELKSVAAQFMVGHLLSSVIGTLSEGQKGLVVYAKLYMQRPELIIMDEPTNHINFRHIPVLAAALQHFKGFLILVSHDDAFCEQIKVNQLLDLGTLVDPVPPKEKKRAGQQQQPQQQQQQQMQA